MDRFELKLGRNEVLEIKIENRSIINNKNAYWTSNNAEVAVVDYEGRITAKVTSTATITAKLSDKTATCMVPVTKI